MYEFLGTLELQAEIKNQRNQEAGRTTQKIEEEKRIRESFRNARAKQQEGNKNMRPKGGQVLQNTVTSSTTRGRLNTRFPSQHEDLEQYGSKYAERLQMYPGSLIVV